jgi:hypothetical protein
MIFLHFYEKSDIIKKYDFLIATNKKYFKSINKFKRITINITLV